MDYSLISSSVADVGSNINATKPTGVSCLAFDSEQEILWVGNYSGHVTSFVPSPYQNLVKYTSFHIDYESDIRQLTTCRDGVLSLTKNAIRLSKRRGLTQFTHKSDLFIDLQCMLYKNLGDSKSGHIYLAGNQDQFIECDLETRKHVRVIDTFDGQKGIKNCYYMKGHPKFVCMADGDGKIVLRDADLLQVQHEFKPTSLISSFDACGNYLVTCSSYSQLLMIYDLREMKLISATQVYMPTHLKFLSRFVTKCCIASRNGHFGIVDLTCPNNINSFSNIQMHTYGAEISAMDVTATDQAFAFGDNHNFVYIHGTCDKFNINTNPTQPEYADALIATPYVSLVMDQYTPISEVAPFPYYVFSKMDDMQELASYMPAKQCSRIYRPTPPIGADLLRSMRVAGNIGYVVNSSGMIPTIPASNNFTNNSVGSRRNSPEGNEFGTDQMPHRYLFLEPNHNKVDKDEYDFSRYNHSIFPGLDSTMPNSYANNMIQCLYFIPQLRAAILSHLCNKEYCLICELAFLFHILDNAPSHTPCQASNFLRAFRTIPEASAFKLILPEDETLRKQVNFCKLTQQWLRFLLHQLNREASNLNTSGQSTTSGNSSKSLCADSVDNSRSSFITEHFSLTMRRNFECGKCHNLWHSPHLSFPVTLNYPTSRSRSRSGPVSNGETFVNNHKETSDKSEHSFVNFVDLFSNSIVTQQNIQSFCSHCQKFQNKVTEKRCVVSLPNIFAINTGLDNESAIKFWQDQINQFSKTRQDEGKSVITNIQELERIRQKEKPPVQPDSKQSLNSTTTTATASNIKACRYGRNCKRMDCKFFHEHLAGGKGNKEDEKTNLSDQEKSFSWIPTTLYIIKNPDGAIQFKDNLQDCTASEKEELVEYSLVNVTSVVKSGEETFGNIVSAIKIDKSYFDARRKQIVRTGRRHFGGSNAFAMLGLNQVDESEPSDDEDELATEENRSYTIDSRSCPTLGYSIIDFEKNLSLHMSSHEWYLFNHYSITPISIEEVLSNDLTWKIPIILMYIRKDLCVDSRLNKILRRTKSQIDSSVFQHDLSIAQKIQRYSFTFVPLDMQTEMFQKGDIVAMDAEFVMLNLEETELRSDGTRATIKPSHKSVARISCVRGSGPMEGVPFIDDYIATQDQVADYMTKFSGIQPGDLDVTLSSKHLTTLKSTYLKLRFLVDNGVIFVGHGLRNDFRVINLVVPPAQVIDTVVLFQSPTSRRMVSLRFLAWHFLGIAIQRETHDSVEDAKTALALYHKYQELEANGCAQQAIEKLYQVGKDCGWKVDY